MSNLLAIVDYGMGNLNSVVKAFENLRTDVMVTQEARDLEKADRIVLPGVGAFAEGMKMLGSLGLVNALREQVVEARKPFLGLCLGMQLIARDSYEMGHHQGLGWIPATVHPIEASEGIKSIHIGWNDVWPQEGSPLFTGLGPEPNFYFVHGYHMVCDHDASVVATTHYGRSMVAAVQSDNILGVQFHPEKSQETGLSLLRSFVHWGADE